jgi:hypothetical protein
MKNPILVLPILIASMSAIAAQPATPGPDTKEGCVFWSEVAYDIVAQRINGVSMAEIDEKTISLYDKKVLSKAQLVFALGMVETYFKSPLSPKQNQTSFLASCLKRI